MAVTLTSYIHFNGETKDAMDFYKSVFGGKVSASTFSRYASPEMPVPPEDMEKIMHAYLKGDEGIELMASDAMTGMPEPSAGTQISLTLSGEEDSRIREYWDKLAADATITAPLVMSPWGDTFGMLIDKFGVHWMFNISAAKTA